MLTTNKQSQNLHQIAGVQDLSHQNAAAVSGGAAELATGLNGTGERLRFDNGSFRTLNVFNNRISSFSLAPRAIWRFWTGRNFRGQSVTFQGGTPQQPFINLNTPGLNPFNNNIESARRIDT